MEFEYLCIRISSRKRFADEAEIGDVLFVAPAPDLTPGRCHPDNGQPHMADVASSPTQCRNLA